MTASTILRPKPAIASSPNIAKPLTPTLDVNKSDDDYFSNSEEEIEDNNHSKEVIDYLQMNQINTEIEAFCELIKSDDFIKSNTSANSFWLKSQDQYPHLSKLFLKTSINSSSAIIERFFSICGIINTQRNQNMEFELFEILAIHSSNFKILEKLKK